MCVAWFVDKTNRSLLKVPMVKPNTDASAFTKASSDDWNLANSAEFWWPDAQFAGEINEMPFTQTASGQCFLGRIKKLEEQLTVAKCSYFANNLISALINLADLIDLSESGVWSRELALLRYHGGGFFISSLFAITLM